MEKIPILLLEYKNYWLTANVLYCLARTKQFEIHFLSRNTKSPFRFSPHVKSHHHQSADHSDEAFLTFAKEVTERTKAKVLVPTSDVTYSFILQHLPTLQTFINVVPLPEKWAYEITMHKGLTAAFVSQHGIPMPLTITDLTNKLEEQLEGFPFPVLLKPAQGASGQGINGDPGITYFEDKEKLLAYIQQQRLADRYIIQQFVEGFVLGCNVLYREGQLINYSIQKGLFKVKPFMPSVGIEFVENREVIEVVDSLMSKLKWNGVANIDLIYDVKQQKVLLLEVNPRYWLTINGSMVAANVNFPVLTCLAALNQPVEKVPSRLGKYIPLMSYLKHKMGSLNNKKGDEGEHISFKWGDVDTRYYFSDLLSRACYFYDKKSPKKI